MSGDLESRPPDGKTILYQTADGKISVEPSMISQARNTGGILFGFRAFSQFSNKKWSGR